MINLKDISVRFQSSVFYDMFFWDSMGFLFIGMVLFRWRILTGERSKKFYWLLTLAGYSIGLGYSYYSTYVMKAVNYDFSLLADKYIVDLYQEKRLLIACGHIGVVMLLYKYELARRLLDVLAKVGQMAFSNYLFQSIICAVIFYGFGFGKFGELQRYETYYVVGAIWLFQIIFSYVWLRFFYFGPFEWVWRSLTYWKRQPMKKTAIVKLEPSMA
jgi:uncharacterized protein